MMPPSQGDRERLTAQIVSSAEELRAFNRDFLRQKTRFMVRGLAVSGHREAAAALNRVDGTALDWAVAAVAQEALETLRQKGCPLGREHLYFIHPEVLRTVPGAVAYYRNLLVLSKKAAGRFVPILAGAANLPDINSTVAEVEFLNSLLVELLAEPQFAFELIQDLPLLSIGATLDGRWRDASGDLQTLEVVELLVQALGPDVREVEVLGLDPGPPGEHPADKIRRAQEGILAARAGGARRARVSQIRLGNEAVIVFPPDPDLLIRDPQGRIVAGGEIKGATDPANVWERWPLVVKTIGEFHEAHPQATTFFFGLCVTRALALGLGKGGNPTRNGVYQLMERGVLHEAFNFYRVRNDPAERERFARAIRKVCSLE